MSTYKEFQEDFKGLAENDKLSHAYLFFGEDSEKRREKFIFAKSLANFLENGVFEEPVKLLRESLVISPDEKGTTGIDSVRAMRYFLCQKPVDSIRRTLIIEEARSLTTEAQNAALKIVEEPPSAALIIFIADVEDSLSPVLTSRLQKIYFSSSAAEEKPPIMSDSRESIEEVIDNDKVDDFFKALIVDFRKNKIKNSRLLKDTLNRLVLMKQFNLNKRLQLRALIEGFAQKSEPSGE